MFDLRNYKDAIRAAVRQESEADSNWKWKVRSIKKNKAEIGWGYLDYLGEGDKPFVIELIEDPEIHRDGECWITGYMQDEKVRESLFFMVGKHHWDDTNDIEKAIVSCVHAIARRAHNTY